MHALGLRQADVDEWVGGVGGDVLRAMLNAIEIPWSINRTFFHRGVPMAMWGSYAAWGPDAPRGSVGQVWFIATNLAMKHTVDIHRYARSELRSMHTRFEYLIAHTHPRNTLHHKWLERHGWVRQPGVLMTTVGIPYLAYIHYKEAPAACAPRPL